MIWRRKDQVSPELAAAVFNRDREQLAEYLAGLGFRTKWSRDRLLSTYVWTREPYMPVCPAVYIDLDQLGLCWGRWRIEHVKKAARIGKRAEPAMDRLMALCQGHTEDGMKRGAVWATAHRDEQREYLAKVKPDG